MAVVLVLILLLAILADGQGRRRGKRMNYHTATKLLLHFDGDFNDSSIYGHTVTESGVGINVWEADQYKFGSGAAEFLNTTDTITVTDAGHFDFGSDDLTIDFWVNVQHSLNQDEAFWFFYRASGGNVFRFYVTKGGVMELQVTEAGTGGILVIQTPVISSLLEADGWQHIALVRSGDDWYMFIDGDSQTLTYAVGDGSETIPDFTSDLVIQTYNPLMVYIDEYRVVSGIAAWTSNFTPPTSAYRVSSRRGGYHWRKSP
jgi:hypothetical protein